MQQKQHSPILMAQLGNPLPISTRHELALLILLSRATIALGEHEHTGDWDPYVQIQLRHFKGIHTLNGSESDLDEILSGDHIESATGYPEISVNFNTEQPDEDVLSHADEIESIVIECQHPENEEDTISVVIPYSCIATIAINY